MNFNTLNLRALFSSPRFCFILLTILLVVDAREQGPSRLLAKLLSNELQAGNFSLTGLAEEGELESIDYPNSGNTSLFDLFAHKGGMSAIRDNLFVGSLHDSQSETQMSKNKISHVVRVTEQPEDEKRVDIDPAPTYLFIKAADHENVNLRQHFEKVNDFVHEARLNGGSVLIHCHEGVSRSVTLMAAYMMSVTRLGLEDVMRVIELARSQANPNKGFRAQLADFEQEGLHKERKRIEGKFNLKLDDDVLGDIEAFKSRLRGRSTGQI